jgi:hypothetical protein
METQRYCLVSHKHLLRMTALTQKTVDSSVKGYELSDQGFCRMALEGEKELHAIEQSITDRGRALVSAGELMGSLSRARCSSLRIYSALRLTLAAATEIARNASSKITSGHASPSPATAERANLVNSLVRLNTIAVFNRRASYAKTVLHIEEGRSTYEVSHHRAGEDPDELAISRCLEQIAEQAREIADGVTQHLESQLPVSSWLMSSAPRAASFKKAILVGQLKWWVYAFRLN